MNLQLIFEFLAEITDPSMIVCLVDLARCLGHSECLFRRLAFSLIIIKRVSLDCQQHTFPHRIQHEIEVQDLLELDFLVNLPQDYLHSGDWTH